VIQDSLTTGEQIIQIMAKQTPVGLFNRIMGMQNIKGTGLDLVYRWQAWEACHKACKLLLRKEQKEIAAGLKELGIWQFIK